MKIQRNKECWCGSGVKYKKCHYGRELEDKVSTGEAIEHSKKTSTRQCCYAPSELHHECDKRIVNAHTVSKSGSLIAIADTTNHVLGLKVDLPNLIKNNGKLKPEKIGVNKASTFKGFCAKHDKKLFSCIEDKSFSCLEDQCFSLFFRAVAKELYAKEGSLKTSEFLKLSDRGKPLLEQVVIQKYLSDSEGFLEVSNKDILDLKARLDFNLLNDKYDDISHVVIESSMPIPIVVSSVVTPIYDFNGNLVQDLIDLDVMAQGVGINSFSSDGKGYVVFSWYKDCVEITKFIETLLSVNVNDMFSALVRCFFGLSENSFISPQWWDSLPNKNKDKINNLIMSGVNPFENDFRPECLLIKDDVVFTGWDVEKITKVNL